MLLRPFLQALTQCCSVSNLLNEIVAVVQVERQGRGVASPPEARLFLRAKKE
jgi:hypothetical protein